MGIILDGIPSASEVVAGTKKHHHAELSQTQIKK